MRPLRVSESLRRRIATGLAALIVLAACAAAAAAPPRAALLATRGQFAVTLPSRPFELQQTPVVVYLVNRGGPVEVEARRTPGARTWTLGAGDRRGAPAHAGGGAPRPARPRSRRRRHGPRPRPPRRPSPGARPLPQRGRGAPRPGRSGGQQIPAVLPPAPLRSRPADGTRQRLRGAHRPRDGPRRRTRARARARARARPVHGEGADAAGDGRVAGHGARRPRGDRGLARAPRPPARACWSGRDRGDPPGGGGPRLPGAVRHPPDRRPSRRRVARPRRAARLLDRDGRLGAARHARVRRDGLERRARAAGGGGVSAQRRRP